MHELEHTYISVENMFLNNFQAGLFILKIYQKAKTLLDDLRG